MGGFKNETNNIAFEQNIFSIIISHISTCCKAMQEDCLETKNPLPKNSEDKISNRLVEKFLDHDTKGLLGFRFTRENPVAFNVDTDTFAGRTDIQVKSTDWLSNRNAYFTIEAKRLDGTTQLNEKYVSEGICRFVGLPSPKYASHYGKNIMLGYVVQAINISENTNKIDDCQRKMLTDVVIGNMVLVCDNIDGFSNYRCSYQMNDSEIELTHLFYDFSSVAE